MPEHFNTTEEVKIPQKKDKKLRILTLLGIILAVFVLISILLHTNPTAKSIFKLVGGFIKAPISAIKSDGGRTNILVMGIGGKGHEGGDLTDTMLVVSISLSKPGVTIISLPRDLWIPEIRAKINSAYHYGGLSLAKSSTEKVIGSPIQYTAILDFSSFKNIVDALGGIQVNVERSFTDTMYPIAGKENDLCGGIDPNFACRYETITFKQGIQTMDGETALKFVRSRHADGDEGTDQARETRQQKVIDAIKNKILSPATLINIKKDLQIWKVTLSSIETDIDSQTVSVLARKIYDSRNSITKTLVPEDLLLNPPISKTYDRQYVFIPKAGNGKWGEINTWAQSILR